MTSHGRSLRAQASIEGSKHLSVGRANRQEFVKCENDLGVWQHAPRQGEKIQPQQQKVMEMYDIWSNRFQKFCKALQQQ